MAQYPEPEWKNKPQADDLHRLEQLQRQLEQQQEQLAMQISIDERRRRDQENADQILARQEGDPSISKQLTQMQETLSAMREILTGLVKQSTDLKPSPK